MTQPVFLFGPNASIPHYRSSLERLKGLEDAYDTVYPSHQRWPLHPRPALEALLDCAGQALAGDTRRLVPMDLDMGFALVRFRLLRQGGVRGGSAGAGAGLPARRGLNPPRRRRRQGIHSRLSQFHGGQKHVTTRNQGPEERHRL